MKKKGFEYIFCFNLDQINLNNMSEIGEKRYGDHEHQPNKKSKIGKYKGNDPLPSNGVLMIFYNRIS
jgi:hypothetical protein